MEKLLVLVICLCYLMPAIDSHNSKSFWIGVGSCYARCKVRKAECLVKCWRDAPHQQQAAQNNGQSETGAETEEALEWHFLDPELTRKGEKLRLTYNYPVLKDPEAQYIDEIGPRKSMVFLLLARANEEKEMTMEKGGEKEKTMEKGEEKEKRMEKKETDGEKTEENYELVGFTTKLDMTTDLTEEVLLLLAVGPHGLLAEVSFQNKWDVNKVIYWAFVSAILTFLVGIGLYGISFHVWKWCKRAYRFMSKAWINFWRPYRNQNTVRERNRRQ